jgi:hypothetical protein
MDRMRRSMILAGLIALPASALSAAPPSALAQIAAGVWEVSGAPGSQEPVRQCFADVLTLAQFEHRSRTCSRTVLSDGGASTVVNYSCGPADFGRSEIDVITPRSLRISTQGISGQMPFNYVIQARRVGDCGQNPSPPRH